ncbi:MAG TPA: hypothetical protein VD962_12655 [Rubricoccaceae bacterium]|nr:hypothetical protein [Rubricoccaceae bacterium]
MTLRFTYRTSGFLALAALAGLLAFPSLSGCDTIAGAAGLDEIEIDLGDDAVLPLVPGDTVRAETSVSVDTQDLPDVFNVDEISIPAGAITYTPVPTAGPGGTSALLHDCTVTLDLFVDNELAATGFAVVNDEENPALRSYDFDIAEGVDQDELTDALVSGQFNLAFEAENPGSCAGVIRITQIVLGLDF